MRRRGREVGGIDRLRALIPPPRAGVPAVDWAGVEARAGRVPDDYKALVEAYGPGVFDEFLWVLQPSSDNPNLDLERQRAAWLDALREVAADGERMPYAIETLLPWAVTDNGDVCYWLTVPATDPATWPVVVNESRGPEWVSFAGSATAFLAGALSGEVAVGVFPDDFPSERPGFRPF